MSECPICYEDVTDATGIVKLSCAHTFHLSCITGWFSKQEQGSCPCCRKLMGEKEDSGYKVNEDEEDEDDEEDETLSYTSESSEEDEICIRHCLRLSREKLTSILNKQSLYSVNKEVGSIEWNWLIDNAYYKKEMYKGEECIRFRYDDLRAYVMSNCWKDLSRDDWNELLKEQLDTVSFNMTEFIALQTEIDPGSMFVTSYEWDAMHKSDLFIKEPSQYPGESRIRFTYALLACHITNTCWEYLPWIKWKQLLSIEKLPLTGAFISASIDFSQPIRLPNHPPPHRPFNITESHPLSHYINLIENGQLSVDGGTWDNDTASSFVKNVLQGIPYSITITAVESNPIALIDGRKRIMALSNFYNNMFPVNNVFFRDMSQSTKDSFNNYIIEMTRYMMRINFTVAPLARTDRVETDRVAIWGESV